MSGVALSLNAGSSSVKFCLGAVAADGRGVSRLAEGEIADITGAPHFCARDGAGATLAEQRWRAEARPDFTTLMRFLLAFIDAHLGAEKLIVVGHRVVHGGTEFRRPVRVSPEVLTALARLTPLAPLHQGHNLAPIREIAASRPGLPQIACFDTAFHHTQPELATRLALPGWITETGVRRYGFHGLSYEYIARELAHIDPALHAGRVIVAHLGNGASLCALRGGASVDTTMGFTALDGLVMGTRCGALDPGVPIYLQRAFGLSASAVEDVLYTQSGLLGISGISGDMRALLACEAPAACEAVAVFVRRIVREAGGLAAMLGGLDGFVFTAGIGARAAPVRAAVAEGLVWLGAMLDLAANAAAAPVISTPDSRVVLRVMPTDEDAMILRHALAVLREEGSGP